MKPISSAITGQQNLEEMPANETGPPHGEIGYGVVPRADQPESRKLFSEAQCLTTHGISLRWSDKQPIISLEGETNPGLAVREMRNSLSLKATGDELFDWLSKLYAMTAKTNETDKARKQALVLYRTYLGEYPADIVRDAIRSWPRIEPCDKFPTGGKFFPALAELTWLCQGEASKRKAVIEKLELVGDVKLIPDFYFQGSTVEKRDRLIRTLDRIVPYTTERPTSFEYSAKRMPESKWLEVRPRLIREMANLVERFGGQYEVPENV